MFDFQSHDKGKVAAKVYTTIGALPHRLDPAQPPHKKQPWKTVNNSAFVRSVELLLPEELYELVWDRIDDELKTLRYQKVIMKLEHILEGEFFNEYVKKGT